MKKEEKELTLQHHKTAAEHHAGLGESCKAMSDHHAAASKHLEITDRAASAMHADACEQCKKMAGHHVSLAENHLAAYKAIGAMPDEASGPTEKVRGSDDLDSRLVGIIAKLIAGGSGIPNGLSPIPLTSRPTLVPRTGQHATALDPVSKVDPSLKHLVDDSNEAAT